MRQEELDQFEVELTFEDSKHSKVDQLEDQTSPEKNIEQEELDQVDIILSSEKTMIEESVDFEIAQEELKNATVNPAMKIFIEESNHAEKSYIETIQNWIFL